MGPEIKICYPIPRRRLLDLVKLRRAALRLLLAAGGACVLVNICTGGSAWSLIVLVSMWLLWSNLLARPLVEDGLQERISRLMLGVCLLVLTVELLYGGSCTGIVLPVLLGSTLTALALIFWLGRRQSLMPLLRLLVLAALDMLVSAFGLLPLNLPSAVTLVCLGLAAALPALFADRRRLAYELEKLLHS